MTTIIGFTGRKGSGKDTAANVLVEEQGFANVKFAGALKGMLAFYLYYVGVDSLQAERMIDGDLKEVPFEVLGGKTPRHAMQTLGTEWGRDLIHPDIWVDSFFRRAAQFDNVVCSDVRFPNEIDAIHKAGGKVYRLERPLAENSFSSHESEKLVDTLEVDGIIDNSGTQNDLYWAVLRTLGYEK